MLKDFQRSRYRLLKTVKTATSTPQIESECGLRQNPLNKISKKLSKSPKGFREFFIYTPITLPKFGGNPHTLNLKVRLMLKNTY